MSELPAFPTDVDVAVVSHNGRSTLPEVLARLVACGAPAARITVFDIASTDDTATWLKADWPEIRVATLTENKGPNPARNQAIGATTQPYLLLVDSDAYLEPQAVVALRDAARTDTTIGATVPVVVHADRPDTIQYAGSRLHFICEAINPFAEQSLQSRGDIAGDIGTAPGVTFLLNVAAARAVGGFDDRYFMGKEDGEFCYRLKLAGYRLVETPAAIARHGTRPRTTWLFPFQVRNRWHFMLKNYQMRSLLVLGPALLVHEVVQAAMLVAKGHGVAWWRGFVGVLQFPGSLAADRRAVARLRRVPDAALLDAAPLVVRKDLVGGSLGASAKRVYDAWLMAYWRAASRLLK